MALLPRVQTGFLNTDAANQLTAQQIGSGFSALAGGISKRFDQQRQDRQMAEQREAQADAAETQKKMQIFQTLAKDESVSLKTLMNGMFPEMKDVVDFDTIDNNRKDYLADTAAYQQMIKENPNDRALAVEGLQNLSTKYGKKAEDFIRIGTKALPTQELPEKISVDLQSIDKQLRDEGLPVTPENRKKLRDRLASEESKRIAKGKTHEPLGDKSQFVINLSTGGQVNRDDSTASLKEENIETVTLNTGSLSEYNDMLKSIPSMMRLLDVTGETLTSDTKIGAVKERMLGMVKNLPFARQLSTDIAKIKNLEELQDTMIASIARAQGHVGVLTELDVIKSYGALSRVGDPQLQREFKNMVIEEMIDNSPNNFLLRKKNIKEANSAFREQMARTKRLISLAVNKKVTKEIDGVSKSFSDFFKESRANGLTMEQIEADWKAGGRQRLNMSVERQSKRDRIIRETKAKFGIK